VEGTGAVSLPEGIKAIAYDGVPSQEILDRLNELIESGPFHLEIGRLYELEQAAKAQEDALKHHLGKLALRIH
jgi:NADPH2:quinone reductase